MTLLRWFARGASGRNGASPVGAVRTPERVSVDARDATDPRTIVAQASADAVGGRYARALARVAAALAGAPSDPGLLLARAATLMAGGRVREAADAARRAASSASVLDLDDRLLAGRIFFQSGDYARAEDFSRAALASSPSTVEALANLAAILHAQDRVDAAVTAYLRVLELDPRHMDALIGLGNLYLDRGLLADAEVRFRRAIDVDAESAMAWRCLGQTFDGGDREEEAIPAHRRAFELETLHGDDVVRSSPAIVVNSKG